MVEDKILSLATAVDSKVEPKHIVPLAGGFSSQAYKVNSEQPFILLVAKEGGVEAVNYGHTYVVMDMLQQRGWPHAPKPLWLAPDRRALAMSFSPGVPANHFDFVGVDKEVLALAIMDSLLDIITVEEKEYSLVAKKLDLERASIMETPAKTIQRYGADWLRFLHKSCPDRDVLAWLEPRIKGFAEVSERTPITKPLFIHADLSDPNILLTPKGAFTLIDWGAGRFYAGGIEFSIAYMTNLVDFMVPLTKPLVIHTARRLDLNESDLSCRVEECRRACGISDIYWAALMSAKINLGQTSGEATEFRRLALKRIKHYEHVCE